MTSADLIKQIMETKSLNQKDLAFKLATSQATISRLLNGKYKVSAAMRQEIVNRFDYSFEYVFNEVD